VNRLIEQLKFEEGLSLKAYICPAGKRTIGYGHNLDAKPLFMGVKVPRRITKEYAYNLLRQDIDDVLKELKVKKPIVHILDDARRDAFINMAFQMGVDGFLEFKSMLNDVDFEMWDSAADEALDSKWAKQTPGRAKRVAGQIRTGKYYECVRD
jgi:lysozyme